MLESDIVVRVCASSVNIASNGFLFAAIVLSKNLKDIPCVLLITMNAGINLLLALETIAECCLLPLWISSTKTASECLIILFPLFIAKGWNIWMPLMIALEGLLNVLFPILTKTRQAWRFTVAMGIAPFFYILLLYTLCPNIYFKVSAPFRVKNTEMLCTESTLGEFLQEFTPYYLCRNIFVVVVCWMIYVGIWARLRFGPHSSSTSASSSNSRHFSTQETDEFFFRQVSRPLLVVLVMFSFGITVPIFVSIVMNALNTPPDVNFQVSNFIRIPMAMVFSALITPALYIFSMVHQKAIDNLLARIFCKNRTNLVDPKHPPIRVQHQQQRVSDHKRTVVTQKDRFGNNIRSNRNLQHANAS